MKRQIISKVALCACGTLLVTGVAWSENNKAKDSDKACPESAADQKLCQSSKMVGATVYDSKGESIGKVHDLVFSNGRIEFGLLSLNVPDHQGHIVAVPWEKLQPKEDRGFTLGVEREKLLSAKMWKSAAEIDLNEPDFAKRTYTHYGLNWDDRMSVGGRVTLPGGVERGESENIRGRIEYNKSEGSAFPRPQPDGRETFPYLNPTEKDNR